MATPTGEFRDGGLEPKAGHVDLDAGRVEPLRHGFAPLE